MARKKREPEIEEEIIYVSKSEIKRDVQELHQLGTEIAALAPKARERLPLNHDLAEAMVLADKLSKKKEAYRRHLNYIAKQLRLADNIEEIKQAMALIANKNQQATVLLHQLELLRDELIAKGDAKANELINEHPDLDRQKLRQLIRQAKKEVAQKKPGKSYRELYQYLKETMLGL